MCKYVFYPWLVSLRPQDVHARQMRTCDDVSGNKTAKDTEEQRTRYQGAREVSGLISKGLYFIHSFHFYFPLLWVVYVF